MKKNATKIKMGSATVWRLLCTVHSVAAAVAVWTLRIHITDSISWFLCIQMYTSQRVFDIKNVIQSVLAKSEVGAKTTMSKWRRDEQNGASNKAMEEICLKHQCRHCRTHGTCMQSAYNTTNNNKRQQNPKELYWYIVHTIYDVRERWEEIGKRIGRNNF